MDTRKEVSDDRALDKYNFSFCYNRKLDYTPMNTSTRTRSHVKFESDNQNDSTTNIHSAKNPVAQNEETDDSDTDSDADGDAPEEEDMTGGKLVVENEIKEREEALKNERKLLRERRRQQDAKYTQQQLEKESLKAKSQKEVSVADEEEVLEELPEHFFSKLDGENVTTIPTENMAKHVNFNELDTDQYEHVVKVQLRKKNQKILKKLRATSVKRGPVNVTLLASSQSLSSMAPKKETPIMNTRDRWLRRKSVKRK